MADVPRTWQILEAALARLQTITVAGGYRTNAGADVRLEPSADALSAPRLTLYSVSTVHPEGRPPNEREFTMVIEALVPAAFDAAHAQVVKIAEDIEQALDRLVLMPNALPLQFQESLFLDRPDGMPVMAAQLMFATGYRR